MGKILGAPRYYEKYVFWYFLTLAHTVLIISPLGTHHARTTTHATHYRLHNQRPRGTGAHSCTRHHRERWHGGVRTTHTQWVLLEVGTCKEPNGGAQSQQESNKVKTRGSLQDHPKSAAPRADDDPRTCRRRQQRVLQRVDSARAAAVCASLSGGTVLDRARFAACLRSVLERVAGTAVVAAGAAYHGRLSDYRGVALGDAH